MKKIVAGALVIALAAIVLWQTNRSLQNSQSPESALGAPPNQAEQTVLNGQAYSYAFVQANPETITLNPNYTQKLTTADILQNQDCTSLVSAGFYTPDQKPVGYFESQDQVLRAFATNNLFNGILSLNDFATPRLTRAVPTDHLLWGLQSGPILIENDGIKKLNLTSDQPARRIVAAITGANELYFLAFWNPDSAFEGPLLADLPSLLAHVEDEQNLDFADAVNLDGGTASSFISGAIKLSELSPLGSYFCF